MKTRSLLILLLISTLLLAQKIDAVPLAGWQQWDFHPYTNPTSFVIFNYDRGPGSGGGTWWTSCSRDDTTGYCNCSAGDTFSQQPSFSESVPIYVGKPLIKATYWASHASYYAQNYAILDQYNIYGDVFYWVAARSNATGAFDFSSSKMRQRPLWRYLESLIGDPVDTATGNQVYTKTLISIEGALPIDFTLEFATRPAAGRAPWGDGWGHNYQGSLTTSSTGATVTWSPNRIETFSRNASGAFVPLSDGTQSETLILNADGTYTLTAHDQTRYAFASSGTLQSIWKHGKYIDLTYGSNGLARITDRTTGRYLSITYAYDPNTWLYFPSSIQDGNGRAATLSYTWKSLSWVTDANGNKTTFAYAGSYPDAKLASATDVSSNTVLFTNTYDSARRIVSQTDAAGRPTTFSYDLTSVPGVVTTTVTNRDGFVRKFSHDFNLYLTKVVDETNATTAYTNDAAGNRVSVQDALGRTSLFTYDPQCNLLSATDPNGGVAQMSYDASNNLTQITDAAGKTTSSTFDGNNNLLTATNAKNEVTTCAYNANGQITARIYAGGGAEAFAYTGGFLTGITDRVGNTSSLTYDTAGRVASIADAAGKTTSLLYDAMGNVLRATLPGGAQWQWTYNWQYQKVTEKDPLNQTTTFQYNSNGELTQTTAPLGTVTKYGRSYEQALSNITDANNNVTQFGRDGLQRLTSIVDPLQRTQQFAYDAVGNQTAIFNAANTKTSELIYNNRDLPTTLKDAYGAATTVQYDSRRRLSSQMDPLSRTTQIGYDDLHRMTSVQNPASLMTGQAFDANGNRTSLTNAANATTAFQFDAAGRIALATTATGKQTAYSYNTRNLLASATDPKNQVTTFTYDDPGRLATATDAVGQITYGRDLKGRVLTVAENGKTITRSYDALDRLVDYTDGSGNHLHYTYDAAGNLLTLTYPDNAVVTYGYDPLNRMTTVTDWANRVTTYGYDLAGRLATTTRPNGTVETRTYDANDRLLSIVDRDANSNVIASSTLTRDAIGRITTETAAPVPWLASGTLVAAHGYDLSDRLTSRADTDGGATTVMTHAISVDDASNIMSSTINPLSVPGMVAENVAMTYDADNRISTFNGTAAQYDDNGNMTEGPLGVSPPFQTFVYDARNRLTSVGGASFGYDAEHHRVSMTDAGGSTAYVVNPQPVLDQVILRTDSTGTTRYIYGLGLIAEERGANYLSYHYDSRGSTVAVTDASGSVIGRASYGAYGELVKKDASLATPFLFNGELGVQTDSSGLLYMRARFYSPVTKRFVNQDDVLGSIEDSASLNRFSYANGNPASLVDPFGLCASIAQKIRGIASSLVDSALNISVIKDSIWVARHADDWREFAIGTVSVPILAADTASNAIPILARGKALAKGVAESALKFVIRDGAETEAKITIRAYEVGTYKELKARSAAGDGLDIHHAPQQNPISQTVPGYNALDAPAIAVPRELHKKIPVVRGPYNGSARDQVAKDIRDLREFTAAPNSSLQELIKLSKKKYLLPKE